MSNTISAEEYRKMIKKKYDQHDVPETTTKGKKEPSGKTGKLDTVAALKAMGNYFELDAKSVNFFIVQMRNSGKL